MESTSEDWAQWERAYRYNIYGKSLYWVASGGVVSLFFWSTEGQAVDITKSACHQWCISLYPSYMTHQILSRTFTEYIICICDPNLRTAKVTNLELSTFLHMLTNDLWINIACPCFPSVSMPEVQLVCVEPTFDT